MTNKKITLAKTNNPRVPAAKYGIAEWYGECYEKMSSTNRLKLASIAKLSTKIAQAQHNVPCPFRTFQNTNALCNKRGGVCSIRQYDVGTPVTMRKQIVSLCPSRLLDKDVLIAVAQTVLGTHAAYLVKEVPFLFNTVVAQNGATEASKAGRIDWLLVDKSNTENFCAVETQSVYFSGDNMPAEFDAIIAQSGALTMPAMGRRPDYRSSVPKRLSPQLQAKGPVLTNWGKKIVVIVDDFVGSSMGTLNEVKIKATGDEQVDRQNKLDNCQIVWFIVTLIPNGKPTIAKIAYTTLQDSLKALEAADPANKTEFYEGLRKLVADPKKLGSKVFDVF